MESIKAIKAANLDYKRISNSANEASNNTFLDENNILKTAWGDENGEVEFVPMDNGTYLIEQDGIGMGFTDEEGYKTAVGDNNSEEPEILELDDEIKKTNDSYDDKTTNEKNTYTEETEKDIIKDTVEEIDKMVKNVENKHDYENNKIENIEEQKNANDLKKDLNSPILQTGNSSFNNDIKQILEERKNNRNIENEEIKQEKTAIGDLKKEYYDGINNNYNIDNISKSAVEATKKIVDNVINENKEKIDKIAAIQKETIPSKLSDNEFEVKKTRYADTTVWYTVIPKDKKPMLGIANDNYDMMTSEAPTEIAKRKNAKIAINFGLTGDPAGMIYADGKLVSDTGNPYDETLYMDQNGILNSVRNSEYSTQDIINMNPVWASKGFYSIARDGQYVDENTIDPSLSIEKHPRTFIGQDYDGNYIIGVCDGRGENEAGMTLREVYDFVNTEVTDNLRFLFNGDGGGSSAFIYEGEKLNPNTDGNERERPDLIYWN